MKDLFLENKVYIGIFIREDIWFNILNLWISQIGGYCTFRLILESIVNYYTKLNSPSTKFHYGFFHNVVMFLYILHFGTIFWLKKTTIQLLAVPNIRKTSKTQTSSTSATRILANYTRKYIRIPSRKQWKFNHFVPIFPNSNIIFSIQNT